MNPEDETYMRMALDLARRGRRRVEPNPMVGAVVVKGEHIVGHGFHARFGGRHAEAAALLMAGAEAAGGTLYVTMEPCAHRGKTPPCTEATIEAGVERVVYAASDEHPVTAGKGPERLREAGVAVTAGILEEEARKQNGRYYGHLGSELPWTIAKWAMTLDGKIADVDGGSKFITGGAARRLVHEIRGAVDGIAVGVGTILADDPDLTARTERPTRRPVRLVVDTDLRTPVTSRVVRTARENPTWIAAGEGVSEESISALVSEGCVVLTVPRREGKVDLADLFVQLKERGIGRLLLEGGGKMHAAALAAGVVRQVMAFVAPVVLGGATAPTPADGPGLCRIGEALKLAEPEVTILDPDVLIEGYLGD